MHTCVHTYIRVCFLVAGGLSTWNIIVEWKYPLILNLDQRLLIHDPCFQVNLPLRRVQTACLHGVDWELERAPARDRNVNK